MSPNILVIRLSSLGDVALTGPVYRNLKAHWPGCRISVLVKPAFAGALEGHPDIDRIIPFRGLREAARGFREARYTHVLDLHATPRSCLLRTLSGAPRVAVYRKDAWARRLFVAFGLTSPSLQRHAVDRYLDALSEWGVPARERAPSLAGWQARSAPARAERTLLIQSAFMGDCALTLPLAARLKELLAGRLSVLCLPAHAEVFRGAAGVDEVLLDDKRGKDAGLLGLWRKSRELRRARFDLAVIPHRSLRSALLARLAGIPRRVGFDSSAGRLLLTDAVAFSWPMHDLERNLALLAPLGGAQAPPAGSCAYLPPSRSASLEALLAAAGIAPGDRLAGLHPGSAWATKRWLPERFAELARRLAAEGLKPVVLGGASDAPAAAAIARASGAADLCGRTDLAQLKALMAKLSLLVTNDSGPMHLAAAAGVPVVAVFGATTRELGFFPYGPAHRVVEASLACRPCGLHGARECPEGHFLCMRLVTVAAVHEACRQALSGAPAGAA